VAVTVAGNAAGRVLLVASGTPELVLRMIEDRVLAGSAADDLGTTRSARPFGAENRSVKCTSDGNAASMSLQRDERDIPADFADVRTSDCRLRTDDSAQP